VPSSPLNTIAAPFKIVAGVAIALAKLLKLKPAAVMASAAIPACR